MASLITQALRGAVCMRWQHAVILCVFALFSYFTFVTAEYSPDSEYSGDTENVESSESYSDSGFSDDIDDLRPIIMKGKIDITRARVYTLLLAGAAAMGASHLSSSLIAAHLKWWEKPHEQTAIIWIVLMVPIFAIDSFIVLAEMPGNQVVCTVLHSVKECYEAFAIFQFLQLLYSYMGVPPNRHARLPDIIKGRVLPHSFPLSLFMKKGLIVDHSTLTYLYWGVFQFVVVRPIFSVLMCILQLAGLYQSPVSVIIPAIFNVSISTSLYSLLMFYHGFERELQPHRPFAKFACIKGVVFFGFWQGMVIKLLAYVGVIHQGHFPYSVQQIEEAAHSFLSCIEMLCFAFFFRYAYSPKEYEALSEEEEKPKAKKESEVAKGEKAAGEVINEKKKEK